MGERVEAADNIEEMDMLKLEAEEMDERFCQGRTAGRLTSLCWSKSSIMKMLKMKF
jgi:hypothetical protein